MTRERTNQVAPTAIYHQFGVSRILKLNGVCTTGSINRGGCSNRSSSEAEEVSTVSFSTSTGSTDCFAVFIAIDQATTEGTKSSNGVVQITADESCDGAGANSNAVAAFTATQQRSGASKASSADGVKTIAATNRGASEGSTRVIGLCLYHPHQRRYASRRYGMLP